MEAHPATELFPMMGDAELQELADDIAANGLQVPIVTFQGKILDGRNRYAACELAGIQPHFSEWQGTGSPTVWVLSLNLHRRHLTPSQKAAIAVDLLPLLEVEAQDRQLAALKRTPTLSINDIDALPVRPNLDERGRSDEKAAELLNVSRGYVADAKRLSIEAPDLFEQVRSGEQTIPQAKKELRHRELASEIKPLPTSKYRVLYADPPWSYGDQMVIEKYGTAERHYSTMTISELCQLPVRQLVDDSAVLFMWVTSPLLDECWPVIKSWGFDYKAAFVWDKVGHNWGHYNSVRHELLLICTRGSCLPDTPELTDSVQSIPKTREHSRKPEEFRQIIDRMYPNGRRVELFARGEVPQPWEAWGNEA